MRKECFACSTTNPQDVVVASGYPHCTALKRTYCSDPNYKCPFYKPYEQWAKEVNENNGTTNLKSIVYAYSEQRGGCAE